MEQAVKNTHTWYQISRYFHLFYFHFLGKWSYGGIPLDFLAIWGYCKMRPREAFPHAPTGSEFNSDALARCPQAMPGTPALFLLFFGHVVGANGTAALEGSNECPLSTKRRRGIPSKLY